MNEFLKNKTQNLLQKNSLSYPDRAGNGEYRHEHDDSLANSIHGPIAPENMPHPIFDDDWKKATDKAPAKSGVSMAFLTIDNIEHALDFSKRLFKEGLVSAVQIQENESSRQYLKFGRVHTDLNKLRMEILTDTDKVTKLIDYTNHHPPTPYDYPVPDMQIMPVKAGNKDYLKWIKKSVEKGMTVKLDEEEKNIAAGEKDYETEHTVLVNSHN